jgi:hypothetical protein
MSLRRSKKQLSSKQERTAIDILTALAENKLGIQIQAKDDTYVLNVRYKTEL